MVTLFLIFWGNAMLFPLASAPTYIPTSTAQGFYFLHSLTDIHDFFVLLVTARDISLWYQSVFTWWLVALSIFPCTCWPFVCLWESVISGSLCALVMQSCPTLCNPTDCSPPSSSAHGILQARILKWTAIPFSRGSCRPRDQALFSCVVGTFFAMWATGKSFRCFAHV